MFINLPDHNTISSYLQGKNIPAHEQIVSSIKPKVADASAAKKQLNAKDFNAIDINSESFKKNLPYIKEAQRYAKEELGYEIPKGLLETIFMQESSAGTNATNRNPKLGDSAYMVGLASEGIDHLKKIGFQGDYNKPQDTFKGIARLLADKSKVYDYDAKTNVKSLNQEKTDAYAADPALLYSQRYYGGKDKEVYNNFKQRLDYYSNIDY